MIIDPNTGNNIIMKKLFIMVHLIIGLLIHLSKKMENLFNLKSSHKDYVLQDEVVSQRDLTGDGNIGDKVAKVLSKFEPSGLGLFKAESGALVLSSTSNNEGNFFQNSRFVLSTKVKEMKYLL